MLTERRTGVPAHGRTGVPEHGRTGVPAHGRTGAPAHGRTGVPAHGRTGAPPHVLGDLATWRLGASSAASAVRAWVESALAVVRQVVGAPDYQRYLDHHTRCHAGAAPLGPREYYAEFVTRRFGSGPTRCC